MNLLVDIGNSRLKWGLEHAGTIQLGEALDQRRADLRQELLSVWQGIAAPRKLAIASVGAVHLVDEVAELALSLWPAIELLIPSVSAITFGVSNAYRLPEKLGIDRWLAILAAHRYYPGCCCVVDCGTAITVDVIDAGGRHLGGLISPGLFSMKKALASDTLALDLNPQRQTWALSDNTAGAIDSGTLLASVGLIEAVLRRLNKPCQLILSGGDAEAVAAQLLEPYVIDPELVLRGLSIYCNPEEAHESTSP